MQRPTKPPTLPVSKVRTDLCRIVAGGSRTLKITVNGKVRAALTVYELSKMEA